MENWKCDRYEKEPPKLLLKLFLFGALTTVSAFIIEILFGDVILGFMDHNGILFQLIDNFLIVALCIFFMLKGINKMNQKKEEAPAEPAPAPEPTAEEKLLSEIRDLLKNK